MYTSAKAELKNYPMWLLEDDVQEEIQKKSKHNDIAGVKAVGRRKRCNYSINYLISIHLKDPLT